MEMLQQSIQTLKEKLSDKSLSALEHNSIQEKLNEKEARWLHMSESEDRYIISENDLENYHRYGDCLYFQAPSVFDPATEEGMNVRQLRDRFCMGDLTAEQLIKELDDLAWMLEMESL